MIASEAFPTRLKELRTARKISQTTLAKKLGASQSMVTKWDTGKREPTQLSLLKVAEYFGVTVDYLLGRTDNPLTVATEQTPYEQVTPFEKEFLQRYRRLSDIEQAMVCRQLGLEHPAETRLRAKKASS